LDTELHQDVPIGKEADFFKAMSSGKATFLNNKAGSAAALKPAKLCWLRQGWRPIQKKISQGVSSGGFLCGDTHRTKQNDIQKISKDDAYETPIQKNQDSCALRRDFKSNGGAAAGKITSSKGFIEIPCF
jgi:hypothetical protein